MTDEREELATLVGGVRALLESYLDTGADEIPGNISRSAIAEIEEATPKPRFQLPKAATPSPARAPVHAAGDGLSAPPRVESPGHPSGGASGADAPNSRLKPATAEAGVRGKGGIDPIAKRVRLEEIAKEVAQCVRCPLHEARTQTVFARGNPEAELMFVGEGPGADEDAQGEPFVGKAGQLLDKMIEAMGYAPSDVYIANIVKCRPPNNRKPDPKEMEACEGFLHEQIALVQPKVIVALGATAVEGLLKISGITKLRGTWRLYRGEIPVMPTFHPAYLLRQPQDKRLVWQDLQQVMQRLGKSPAK